MSKNKFDVIIIGGGIVGLTIAYLISEKNKNLNLWIIEKEENTYGWFLFRNYFIKYTCA